MVPRPCSRPGAQERPEAGHQSRSTCFATTSAAQSYTPDQQAGGTMQPDSPLGVGDAAPDFALAVADGDATMLSDLRGDSVLLVLASPHWDPASEMLAALYPGESYGAPTPRVVMERRAEVSSRFGVPGSAALYVVDEFGVIRWRYVAGFDVAPQSSVNGECRS